MSFLAHYSGRTLEVYRYDLRCFFQWAADSGIAVLDAARAHIEVYCCRLEDRGLAPWTARTIDLAIGDRHEGPILRRRDGQRLDRCRQDFDRHAAYVVVAFVAGG